MAEFWELSFRDKQTMWGFEPADSAIDTVAFFSKNGIKKILIPGFGYGRNAKIFTENGFDVTGIEISKTAVDLAKKYHGDNVNVHLGSVIDMPFDKELFDGVFCYALIHLLNAKERGKLIKDCFNQLRSGGYMVFVAISKSTAAYGQGEKIDEDTYLTPHGATIFYYDANSVGKEFGDYGILEAKEINEPVKNIANKSSQRFWRITCIKL